MPWMIISFFCVFLLLKILVFADQKYCRNGFEFVKTSNAKRLGQPYYSQRVLAAPRSGFYTSLEAADFCDFVRLVLDSGGNLEKALQVGCSALTSSQGIAMSVRLRGLLACGASVVDALSAAAADAKHNGGVEVARACALSSRMGSGVGPILGQVAQTLRERVSTKLEERAARLPVLMLFPLVVFILPVIILLLTGGAVAEFAKMLVAA